MRKALMIGIPLLIAGAAGSGYLALHNRDPIAAAKQQMARGNMRGAEQYLRLVVRAHPNDAEAAFLLGNVDLGLGNPEAAELELRRALARGYSRQAIVMPLGQAYLQQRHFDEALRDFRPDDAPQGALGDTLTIDAAARLSLGDTKGAQATIARALEASPSQHDTLLTAARIALAANDDTQAAIRTAKVLAAEPNQPDAVLLNADIAMHRNRPAAALADARAVLASNPARLDARLVEARALAAEGQIDGARSSLQKVLHGSPKNVTANYLEAMLAIQQADYPAADNAMTTISTVVGQLPRGFYFLAVTKLGMGQPAQAEEAVTKFLATAHDDLSALKLLAFIHLILHQPDRTLAMLRGTALASHTDAETLDLKGRALAASGDMKGAESNLLQASRLAPQDTAILNRLAGTEMGRGETNMAELELRRSLKIAPKQRLAGEAIVQADLARGDVPAALADVEILRGQIGDAEEVGVLAAQVRLAGLDMDGAEAQLRDVLKRFPDSRAARLNLVRIFGLRGDDASAQKLLEQMLREHPDDEQALDVLLPSLLASHQAERAVAVAEASHQAAPENAGITASLAGTYVRAGQQERAVGLLDRTSGETNPLLDDLRAHLLAASGKTDLAEAAYRATLRETPGNLRARTDLAGLLTVARRYDDARAALREGLVQTPGNPSLLGAMVAVDLRQGGIGAALAGAAVLRADPQNLPAARALTGDAWIAAGDQRQAAAAYLAAFRTAPSAELIVKAAAALDRAGRTSDAESELTSFVANHPEEIAAQAVLSSLELKSNNLVDAEQHLDAVLAARPGDTATLNNLAWVKEQRGDHDAARIMAERAYFQRPAPEIADTLGWILARQGETQKALMLLSQAVPNLSDSARASAAYHYGWALNAAGRNEEAKVQLAAAVAAKAEFPERDDARRLLDSLK